MKKIHDTIKEIPKFQKMILNELESDNVLDECICKEILNFSTSYYFNILAHACMNLLPNNINVDKLPSAYNTYINETKDLAIYKEIIRFQNISGLFILWSYFEQFVYRISGIKSSTQAGDFENTHKKLLSVGIKRSLSKRILNNFSGIRRTRNSLHQNGTYTSGTKEFEFEVQGNIYKLIPDKNVKPIRLMDLFKEIWDHYQLLKNKKTKANK